MPKAPPPVVHASVDALAHVAPVPLEVTLPLPPSPAAPALDAKFFRLRAWLLDNGARATVEKGRALSKANERDALDLLSRMASQRLQGYAGGTAEEDDALLVGGTLSTTRSTVVRCRRDEKRVLGDALSDVEKRIREIRDS